ncbi:MAG TPA: VWA domain-containing protein [Streptosporangiaceae bacterium]|jgi:hypothetical protein
MSSPVLAAQLTSFARSLRAAGVAADTSRVIAASNALAEFQPLGTPEIYWATRLTFCSRRSDLPVFDAVFLDWFGAPPVDEVPGDQTQAQATVAGAVDSAGPASDEALVPGRTEHLTQRDLAELSPDERAQVNILIAALAPGCKPYRTMRHEVGGHRRIDRGRTLRAMTRNGGEPAHLAHWRPLWRPAGLVLLLDVSGSMADYTDALLRFAHAATRARPATTEVFTLATRLTRITAAMRVPDPQVAIDRVGRLASDWRSGTLLTRTLRTFLREWGGRRAVRSAVVVLFSDGWSSDDEPVGEHLGRLSRLARFVIWADPAASENGYQPAAPALLGSLPAIDALVPAGSFAALRALAQSLPQAERGAIGWHPLEYHARG